MGIDTITIRYGDIELISQELTAIGRNLGNMAEHRRLDHTDLGADESVGWMNAAQGAHSKLLKASETMDSLADVLDKVYQLCEEKERAVKGVLAQNSSAEGFDYNPPKHSGGHAGEYYTGLDAAAAQKKKDDENKAKADAEAAAKREALLAFLATYFPETYAAYMQKLHEQEEEEWLALLRDSDDPLDQMLYKLIMEEKQRQEEAKKAADEATAAMAEAGMGADDAFLGGAEGLGVDGGLGSDLGGGGGGLGDLGLGSDLGGGGFGSGLDDFGSGWENDLLDEAIDSDELLDAQETLSGIVSSAGEVASAAGVDAVKGAMDLSTQEAQGLFGQYGDKLASLAQAYGLQAAAVLGGAAVLYATREQTTEAVAYMAEFVSTKCKPFASDVMDQVSGAAKKTRVDLGNAKSRVVAAARGERVGDLIG